MIEKRLEQAIRDVPDFPKKGIIFKDIMPVLEDPDLTAAITEALAEHAKEIQAEAIMGIESRGFFWGLLLSQALNLPFIPVRKKGKLPYKTISHKYDLEYGSAEIEVQEDAIKRGSNVLIHDDLLATGGTAAAAAALVEAQGAKVVGFSFLVILDFLKGEQKLKEFANSIKGIVRY